MNDLHCNESPCICPTCGLVLSSKGNLKSHIASVHEQKESFKCSVCDKGFKYNSSLKRHINRFHNNNNTEECKHCHKLFKNMNSHVAICSNPFRLNIHKCAICSKTFKEKRYLKEHVRYAHEDARYKCSSCDAMFAHRKSKISHEKVCK